MVTTGFKELSILIISYFILIISCSTIASSTILPIKPNINMPREAYDKISSVYSIIIDLAKRGDCSSVDYCLDHGECILGGKCLCNEGYGDIDCSQPIQTVHLKDGEPITFDPDNVGGAKEWLEGNGITDLEVGWPTRTGITEEEARKQCHHVFEDNPFEEICSPFMTDGTPDEFMDRCLNGIKIVSQLNFAYVSRTYYITACLNGMEAHYAGQIMKPDPKYDENSTKILV